MPAVSRMPARPVPIVVQNKRCGACQLGIVEFNFRFLFTKTAVSFV